MRSHKWWSGKKPVTFQVKINALVKMDDIGYVIASSFEHFDLVIETFDKATGFTSHKIIQDFIPPIGKCFDKTIETVYPLNPGIMLNLRKFWCGIRVIAIPGKSI